MLIGMEDIARRLTQARKDAGYETAQEACDRFEWTPETYRKHEQGTRGLKRAVAEKYARAFNVSVHWLLFGGQSSRHNRATVPVIGYVGAGAEVELLDGEAFTDRELEEVQSPPGAAPNTVAVRVRGESMIPAYRPNDLLFYSERGPLTQSDHRQERIVWLDDGRVFLKTVLPGSRPGLVSLTSWNAEPIVDVAVRYTAKIDWIKRS
jgi:hypothetical protein